MQKTLLISFLLFSGVAMAKPQFSTSTSAPTSIHVQVEKEKIEPNDLPDPVKNSIIADDSINKFPIAEAWQVTISEGIYYYIVTFENGTEEKVSKKYDEEGTEIKD